MSAFATIADLRANLGAAQTPDQQRAYAEKMLHKVPAAPVVDRAGFLVDLCRGKRVLEFGASGPMHDKIRAVAASCVGVDRADADGVIGFDLDDVTQSRLPEADPEVIVCGEVLEHLGNPQWFLTRLRRQFPGVTVVLTVPNAFSAAAATHMARGTENVNRDHVAWYSYRTVLTLLQRAGYTHNAFAWYGGQPYRAEGLIVVME